MPIGDGWTKQLDPSREPSRDYAVGWGNTGVSKGGLPERPHDRQDRQFLRSSELERVWEQVHGNAERLRFMGQMLRC